MTFFKQFGFTGNNDIVKNKETDQLLAKDLTKSIDIQPNMTLKHQTSYTGTRQNLSKEQDSAADQQQTILAIKQQVQQQQHKLESKLALLKQVSNVDGISTPLRFGSQKPTRMQSRLLDYKLRHAERTNREDYYRNRANQLSDQLGYYNTFNSSDEKSVSALKTQQQEVDGLRTQVEKMQAQMALLHKELESKEVTLQQHILIVDNLQQVVQQQQAKQIDQQEEFLQLNDRYSKQLQIAQAATIAKSKIELELAELHDQYLKIKSENLDMERKYNQMSSEINGKNALIEKLQTDLEKQTKKAQEKKEQLKQYQQLNIQLQQQQCNCPRKNIQRRMVQVSSSLKDNIQQKEYQQYGSDEDHGREEHNGENFFRGNQQLNQSTEMRPEIDLSIRTESHVNETIDNNLQNMQQLSMKEMVSDVYSKIQPNESQNMEIDVSKSSGINFRQFRARSSNQTPDQLKHQYEAEQDVKSEKNSNEISQNTENVEEMSNGELPSNVMSESKRSHQDGLTDLGTQALLDSKDQTTDKLIQANDITRKAEEIEARHGLDQDHARQHLKGKVIQKLQNMFGQDVKLSTPENESLTDKTISEQQEKLLKMKKNSEQISQLSKELSEAVSRLENEDEEKVLQSSKKPSPPFSQSIAALICKLENGEKNIQDLTEQQQEELQNKGYDVIIHQQQLNEDFVNHSLQSIINRINNNEQLPELSESQEVRLKELGYDIGPKVVESQILMNGGRENEEECSDIEEKQTVE